MLQNKQHIFFWRGHVEKKVKNIHFFFKKQGTQQFPKGNQFCVSVILHLNTNRESVSITAKGGIHIFQVSVNLNVLEHYYQKMSYFFFLRLFQYVFETQALQSEFSTNTCSFHISNLSPMNDKDGENSIYRNSSSGTIPRQQD